MTTSTEQNQDLVSRTRAALLRQQQIELAAWARATVAQAEAGRVTQRPHQVSTGTALGVASSDLSSLRQAGVVTAGTSS
jgi:hypothetical protein